MSKQDFISEFWLYDYVMWSTIAYATYIMLFYGSSVKCVDFLAPLSSGWDGGLFAALFRFYSWDRSHETLWPSQCVHSYSFQLWQ
jgi:hypothetical protein